MKIKIHGREYEVKEYSTKWVLKAVNGILIMKYEVSKKDCPTVKELKQIFKNSDIL